VPQTYGSPTLEGEGRNLAAQLYDSGFGLTIEEAEAAGKLANIRIALVWDVVDAGDTTNQFGTGTAQRQCVSVGSTIKVRSSNGQLGSEVSATCVANEVVTGTVGADRGTAMRARTEAVSLLARRSVGGQPAFAAPHPLSISRGPYPRHGLWFSSLGFRLQARQFWQNTLRIRPVRDSSITIDVGVRNAFALTTTSVPNADLVVIMTARPSPFLPVAGYANCQQRDQYNRCTVRGCGS